MAMSVTLKGDSSPDFFSAAFDTDAEVVNTY
jgi:hypothetical protein